MKEDAWAGGGPRAAVPAGLPVPAARNRDVGYAGISQLVLRVRPRRKGGIRWRLLYADDAGRERSLLEAGCNAEQLEYLAGELARRLGFGAVFQSPEPWADRRWIAATA